MLCEKDSVMGGRYLQDCKSEDRERYKKFHKSSMEILKKSKDIAVKLIDPALVSSRIAA